MDAIEKRRIKEIIRMKKYLHNNLFTFTLKDIYYYIQLQEEKKLEHFENLQHKIYFYLATSSASSADGDSTKKLS